MLRFWGDVFVHFVCGILFWVLRHSVNDDLLLVWRTRCCVAHTNVVERFRRVFFINVGNYGTVNFEQTCAV
jgi:hypothetical protein